MNVVSRVRPMVSVVGGAVKNGAVGLVSKAADAMGKVKPVMAAAGNAFKTFGSVLMANPLMLYVAAALALAAVVYLVYKNWDKISAFFKKVWAAVSAAFSAAWNWIKGMFLKYTPAGIVYSHWDGIKAWFGNLWQGVKAAFSAAWEWVKNLLLNYTAPGLVYKHWDGISAWFSGMWDKVKAVFGQFWDWVTGWGKKFVDAGGNIVDSIVEGIKNKIARVGEVMADVAKKIRGYLPFSPAKTGALRDIHRVRLMETIAGGLKPEVLVRKMAATMALVHAAIAAPLPVIAAPKLPKLPVVKIETMWNVGKPVLPNMAGVAVPVMMGPSTAGSKAVDVNRVPRLPWAGESGNGAALESGKQGGSGVIKGGNVNNSKVVESSSKLAPVFHIHLNGGATEKDARMVSDELKRTMDKWYEDKMRNKARVGYGG